VCGTDYDRQIAKLLAFMGRYGNQSILDLLDMPMLDVRLYAESVGEILREEADAQRIAGH